MKWLAGLLYALAAISALALGSFDAPGDGARQVAASEAAMQ
jgi:hypothetical protein